MKNRIERRMEFSPDEIKAAIVHWLKDIKDQPAPTIDLAAVKFKLTAKGAVVAWTEEEETA